jgi:hypothetical protein
MITNEIRRRVEQLETLTGTRNNAPSMTLVVEFIAPDDGNFWESEAPGPRPPGRSTGQFTVQVQMGGRSSKQNGDQS